MKERVLKIKELAAEALKFFEVATREDGEKQWQVKSDAPRWVYDMALDARGEMVLADSWLYDFIVDALEHIATADLDLFDFETGKYELESSVYIGELLDWVASDLRRIEITDGILHECGRIDGGLTGLLQMAQLQERQDVYDAVLKSLDMQVDESTEDDLG